MYAKLKGIYASDADPIESHSPENPSHFLVHTMLFIGPSGTEEADTFQTTICSPSGLASLVADWGIVLNYPLIVAEHWDFPAIKQRIEKACSACSGETWLDIIPKLALLGRWEFAGYQQHSPRI